MHARHWRAATLLAVVSAAALVVSTAMIAALVKDPVWVAVAIQRGDTAALAQALVDALAAAARAVLRWL